MFDFVIKNKIKKLIRNSSRSRQFISLDKIRSVFVVFDTIDYDVVDAFVEKLEQMGKRTKAYCYKGKDDKFDYSETPYRVIIPKADTDNSGIPTQQLVLELAEGQYDALFDLSIKENYTLEYIVALKNIPLKVGLKKNNIPLYDLSISKLPKLEGENGSKCSELCHQILYYLSTIRSND